MLKRFNRCVLVRSEGAGDKSSCAVLPFSFLFKTPLGEVNRTLGGSACSPLMVGCARFPFSYVVTVQTVLQ